MESTARTVLAHLRQRQPEMTALLRDLALLESPSHDAASQEPVFARIAAELAAAGLRSRRLREERPAASSGPRAGRGSTALRLSS